MFDITFDDHNDMQKIQEPNLHFVILQRKPTNCIHKNKSLQLMIEENVEWIMNCRLCCNLHIMISTRMMSLNPKKIDAIQMMHEIVSILISNTKEKISYHVVSIKMTIMNLVYVKTIGWKE